MKERYLRIEIPLKDFEFVAEQELIESMLKYLTRNGISEYEFTVSSYEVPSVGEVSMFSEEFKTNPAKVIVEHFETREMIEEEKPLTQDETKWNRSARKR